jgi:hypothetical protein
MPELPPMRRAVVPDRALDSGERTGMGVLMERAFPME